MMEELIKSSANSELDPACSEQHTPLSVEQRKRHTATHAGNQRAKQHTPVSVKKRTPISCEQPDTTGHRTPLYPAEQPVPHEVQCHLDIQANLQLPSAGILCPYKRCSG